MPGRSPATEPVRIVVADASLFGREAVAAITREVPGFELVAVCEDLPQLTAAIDDARPDVVVTDVALPPTSTDEGVRFAVELRESHPEIGVVALSDQAEPESVMDLFRSGSEGRAYLLKEQLHDRSELVAAIRAVSTGGSMIDPKVVELLTIERTRFADSSLGLLTARELEVLREVAEGKSNIAIAQGLRISKRAVEKHIRSIFGKLDLVSAETVSRRVMAVLIYLAAGERSGLRR